MSDGISRSKRSINAGDLNKLMILCTNGLLKAKVTQDLFLLLFKFRVMGLLVSFPNTL
jgi:hypothetical protein